MIDLEYSLLELIGVGFHSESQHCVFKVIQGATQYQTTDSHLLNGAHICLSLRISMGMYIADHS